MEKATLTFSLPRTMKNFIEQKMREGRFSTPSEYIRSLIRDDQDMTGNSDVALLLRRGLLAGGGGEESGQTAAAPSRRRK
jgi:antitoxin ParD1/3/4